MSGAVDPAGTRETARRYYRLVDANEYDELIALFARDVVYDRPGQGSIEGRAALGQFYREDRPLSDGDHDLDAVLSEDGRVAVRGTFSGRQGGDSVSFGFADFHTFDADGLIERRVTFTDRDEV